MSELRIRFAIHRERQLIRNLVHRPNGLPAMGCCKRNLIHVHQQQKPAEQGAAPKPPRPSSFRWRGCRWNPKVV